MSRTSKPSKNKNNDDSSDVSSYDDNMTNDEISRAAKNSYVQNELYERIVKYLKLDDMIKEKQKELSAQVKILKETLFQILDVRLIL